MRELHSSVRLRVKSDLLSPSRNPDTGCKWFIICNNFWPTNVSLGTSPAIPFLKLIYFQSPEIMISPSEFLFRNTQSLQPIWQHTVPKHFLVQHIHNLGPETHACYWDKYKTRRIPTMENTIWKHEHLLKLDRKIFVTVRQIYNT